MRRATIQYAAAPLLATLVILSASLGRTQQAITLTVDASRPVGKTSPNLYGLMTEEINYSYDGGLYAELIRNRAFLDNARTPVHWSVVQGSGSSSAISLDQNQPLNSVLTNSLRIDVSTAASSSPAGVSNDGYWGIPVKPHTRYRLSFHARASAGFNGLLSVAIDSADGSMRFATATIPKLTSNWKEYTANLTTGDVAPTTKTRLSITADRPGTFWLSLVSLFPPTWKNQPNGFRQDLMQLLVDMKPGFLRFPGGNYVEGNTIAERFDWTKTIGPLTERRGHQCPWGYRSTDGMGLLEFLRWCEDMGAEPVLAVYAGYSLRGEHVNPGRDLDPYIQDALDEIEYVAGSTESTWGARRAKDGHPAPFKLRYVEVGNEDFFDRSLSYDQRFAQFYDAIKAKHPELKIISTVGNEQPDRLRVHSRRADVLDEHYYRSVADFLKDSPARFEAYDRKGPEIFVGEWGAYEDYAPWTPPSRNLPPTPSMKAAIGDAAWMTAMERNSDLISMHCYAPLLVNVNPGGRQWRPDLIGYDALRTFGSPSYHTIKMFARNYGDELLKVTKTGSPLLDSATRDSKSGAIIIKSVNPNDTPQTVRIELKGVRSVAGTASATVLSAAPEETNSIDEPAKVIPRTVAVTGVKPVFDYTLPAHSISVLRISPRR